MIELTEIAANEVKDIALKEEIDIARIHLRVGIKGGGCSGFSYLLDLTEDKDDSDEEFSQHGLKVICDPKSYLYLNGTVVDFSEGLMGKGFVFENPNSTSTCGCGSSFSA